MNRLVPRSIVKELDQYIVGQDAAKRVVAVALCNRERRRKLPLDLRAEVTPKNVLMMGPTGVGKTEIARRIATMIGAPFLKVEATNFTEVGYVGRDVDSIISDLVEVGVRMVYQEKLEEVKRYLATRFGTSSLRRAVLSQPAAPLPEWRAGWLDENEP